MGSRESQTGHLCDGNVFENEQVFDESPRGEKSSFPKALMARAATQCYFCLLEQIPAVGQGLEGEVTDSSGKSV